MLSSYVIAEERMPSGFPGTVYMARDGFCPHRGASCLWLNLLLSCPRVLFLTYFLFLSIRMGQGGTMDHARKLGKIERV